MLVKFYESKFGATCTPGLVLLLLTAWYSFTWKILISSAKRKFVIVTDLASFDCLIQVKILWSIYFVNHSNFFWLPTVLSTIYIFDYWGWGWWVRIMWSRIRANTAGVSHTSASLLLLEPCRAILNLCPWTVSFASCYFLAMSLQF